ncbi:hypothetical protein [Aeoliella sp.]|uniref:hypothetical protein n=1 Tax=Aeoliella sp. TaxID=2795800 RepID=UPI003CCC2C87
MNFWKIIVHCTVPVVSACLLLCSVGCTPAPPSKNTPVPDVEPAHPQPLESGMTESPDEAADL